MNIADLLCAPVEVAASPLRPAQPPRIVATCEPPRPKPKKRQSYKPVPDDQRTRPYRMSKAQKKSRSDYEEHESKVFNLTLDINDLKQQVQYLLECRDIQVTCLLQTRQRLETLVLGTVDRILFGGGEKPRSGTKAAASRACSWSSRTEPRPQRRLRVQSAARQAQLQPPLVHHCHHSSHGVRRGGS